MKGRRHPVPKRLVIVGVALLLVIIIVVVLIRGLYYANLRPVNGNTQALIVKIPSGSTINQIADILYQDHLIRSAWAFEWYVHAAQLSNQLEAGSFALSPSFSLQKIAGIIATGHVAEGIVTILPGTTISQIAATLVKDGFNQAAVTAALTPQQYADLPIVADKPAGVNTLEGLLYPDSFDKISSTTPAYIIRESLTEMGQHITPALQQVYAKEGLSVYQAITLASVVEQEVSKPSDRAQVAQVFLSRLKQGMPLGSDVTAYYGDKLNNQPLSLSNDTPFNTLLHAGLPPTPIGTVSQSSLNAVAYPANTNWLYFVTGDNGVTYFETTLQQHNADTAAYCHKLCMQP